MERSPINRLRNKSEEMERSENDAKVNNESGEFEEVLTEQEYLELVNRIFALDKLKYSKDEFVDEAEKIREILDGKLGIINGSRFNLKMERFNQEQNIKNRNFKKINEFSDQNAYNSLDSDAKKEIINIKQSRENEKRRLTQLYAEFEQILNVSQRLGRRV